jgi:hypothetical protein
MFYSYVESRPKNIIMVTTMGHECKRGTVLVVGINRRKGDIGG